MNTMYPFDDLLQKFVRDELTQQELQEFLRLARDPANEAAMEAAIGEYLASDQTMDLTAGLDVKDQFRQVLQRAEASVETSSPNPAPIHRVHFLFRKWWAAAVILLILGAGTFLWLKKDDTVPPENIVQLPNVEPGKTGAILTLSDGTEVVLDTLGNGFIAAQQGTQVLLQNGQLTYRLTEDVPDSVTFNTMTTPKGRQFQLLLPDGTRVWLNAASSIQYPTAFIGKERRVFITGEAYFEVSKDARKPFIAEVNREMEVEVLGTHFNVNGYKDDGSISTTLLEGSVRIVSERYPHAADPVTGKDARSVISHTLKPGQQAIVQHAGRTPAKVELKEADLDQVMAWKNGYFNFEGANIKGVMKQLERWYDISVVYDEGIPDVIFFGEMSRNVNLNDLIATMNDMKLGIKLRLDPSKKLIVSQ